MTSESEPRLPFEGALDAPPPGPALVQAIGSMRPVRTRVPLVTLLGLLVVGAAVPVVTLLMKGTRRDLPFLPPLWVAVMAALWATGVAVPLVLAVVPRRGDVLPDTARAGRAAVLGAVLLVALGLLATVDAPGVTSRAPSLIGGVRHCLFFGLKVMAPVLVVAGLLLRRLHPIGSVGVGAAVGAAAGAMGGLTLHFLCGYGGGLHVGLGHAGGVVLGALIGAIALPRFLRS